MCKYLCDSPNTKLIKMYLKQLFITVMLQFLISTAFFGQDWKELLDFHKKQVEKTETQSQKQTTELIRNTDKAFAESLLKPWKTYKIIAPVAKLSTAKPENIAAFENNSVINNKLAVRVLKDEKLNRESANFLPFIPFPETTPAETDIEMEVFIDFYGKTIKLQIDNRLIPTATYQVTSANLPMYWNTLTGANYFGLINQLMATKQNLNLNDWAYFLLVSATTEKISTNKNLANVLTWFIMLKSNYQVQLGFTAGNALVLLATNEVVYEKAAINLNGTLFFTSEPFTGEISTYENNEANSLQLINFALNSLPNLGNALQKRTLNFEYAGKKYAFDAQFNLNIVQFLADYPQVSFSKYANMPFSSELKQSLLENLMPIIKDKSTTEAATILMRFVQTAFRYKTDSQQFGHEKTLSPEELFHFPFSDSDDRSVLFAGLVQQLLGLNVAEVRFEAHTALGVALNTNDAPVNFEFNNKKYTLFDPSFPNAPAGVTLPFAANSGAKITEILNFSNENTRTEKIWNTLITGGCYKSTSQNNAAIDKNGFVYVTGYFFGKASIGSTKLITEQGGSGFFLAKFDAADQLVWVKTLTGQGSSAGNYLTVDPEENILVSGAFNETVRFENTEISTDNRDVFIAKYSESGALKWVQTAKLSETITDSDFVFILKIDKNGIAETTLLRKAFESFPNYGIYTDERNNLLLIGLVPFNGLTDFAEFASEISRDVNKQTETYNADKAAYFAYAVSAENLPALWKTEMEKLIAEKYDKTIAGIFAFIRTIKLNGSLIDGKTLQLAIDNYNPSFKKTAPCFYRALGNVEIVANTGGIITITVKTGTELALNDAFILENKAKLRVTLFNTGNAQIDFLSGAKLGKSVYSFPLNYIKLFKNTSDIIFDYDTNHSQKTYNLLTDFLK